MPFGCTALNLPHAYQIILVIFSRTIISFVLVKCFLSSLSIFDFYELNTYIILETIIVKSRFFFLAQFDTEISITGICNGKTFGDFLCEK